MLPNTRSVRITESSTGEPGAILAVVTFEIRLQPYHTAYIMAAISTARKQRKICPRCAVDMTTGIELVFRQYGRSQVNQDKIRKLLEFLGINLPTETQP